MTALRKEDIFVTPAEYLAGEKLNPGPRREYVDGVVYDMAGSTAAHSRIASSIVRDLGTQLRGKKCEVFGPDIKIHVVADHSEFYYYPDVSVDCSGSADIRRLHNEEPVVIFEVLSHATERVDIGEKLQNYLRLPSLKVYALVGQTTPYVVVHRRTGDQWFTEFVGDLSATLDLPEIDCTLPLASIYERMGF